MNELVIEVRPREQLGKNQSRRLRRQGEIPAIVYGARKDPVPVCVDPEKILEIIHSKSGANTIFQLSLPGKDQKRHVMIKDYQVDPLKGRLLHADFVRIQMDETIQVDVPIRITGEAAGVKLDGGILEHVTRQVRVSCLPGDIPDSITVDVSALKIGDHLNVSDLPKSPRYTILSEPEQTLVVVSPPAKEETPVAAEAAPAAPAEPEVIKKGKVAAEGEETAVPEEGKKEEPRKKEAKKPEAKK